MLDTWATEHGLQYVILDPITTEETSVSDLRDRTVSSGESLWSAADGVHLSAPSQRSRNRCPRMTLQTRRRLSLWQTAPPRRGPGWNWLSPSQSVQKALWVAIRPGWPTGCWAEGTGQWTGLPEWTPAGAACWGISGWGPAAVHLGMALAMAGADTSIPQKQRQRRIRKRKREKIWETVVKKKCNVHWSSPLLAPTVPIVPPSLWKQREYSFCYNVFKATKYKTTSLPAALNQARRIDTLDVFYLYIACKLVLYIYGDHSYTLLCYEKQFKIKLTYT